LRLCDSILPPSQTAAPDWRQIHEIRPETAQKLLAQLQGIYTQFVVDEYLYARFKEGKARVEYFKRVYEQLDLESKTREECFLIGILADFVFCLQPREFTVEGDWEQLF
jgi:hypothetical protein